MKQLQYYILLTTTETGVIDLNLGADLASILHSSNNY